LTAAAHAALCLGEAYAGRIVEAERHRADARPLVDGLDDDELALRLDAAANLGAAEVYLDRFEDAVAHLGRGLSVGRTTGQGQLFPLLTTELAVALARLGRLDEAIGLLDGAIEAARLTASVQSLAWTLANRAWTAMVAGDLDTAARAAEESAELVRGLEDSPVATWSASILGAILIETGRPERGVDVIHTGAGGPELPLIPGDFRIPVLERVVGGLLALGRRDEADATATLAAELAAPAGTMSRGVAMRTQATVLLANGDAAGAAERAIESAAAAEAIGARIEAARSRSLAGRAMLAAGETERASLELAAAADELDACGAIRARDEAEQALRKLGHRDRRRRRAASGEPELLSALTARELDVARLVVARKTNPEIAAELFLSQKTVETHLRNMFRKLDVPSRVELARAVERAEQDSG
jgi:DNA-binding CsgD family transcriptional regulator